MRIVMLSWLKGKPVGTIKGYGGIERMVGTLTKELIRQGHEVFLIAPPGSFIEGAETIETASFKEALSHIRALQPDIAHDHSVWDLESPARITNLPVLSTSHVMHAIGWTKNVVYLSWSQRYTHHKQVNASARRDVIESSPVIRVPTDPDLKPKGLERLDYLLYLGSVQPHKGVHLAAEVGMRLGRRLIVAGPAAGEYADYVARYPNVEMVGVVDGDYKHQLLEQAMAVMCLHNPGNINWCEPGCGVVGEANAFGTPVAAFYNGCLPELVETSENGWLGKDVDEICHLMSRVTPICPERKGEEEWNAEQIVRQYVSLYERRIAGDSWGS